MLLGHALWLLPRPEGPQAVLVVATRASPSLWNQSTLPMR